jgi:hypothetical protein
LQRWFIRLVLVLKTSTKHDVKYSVAHYIRR